MAVKKKPQKANGKLKRLTRKQSRLVKALATSPSVAAAGRIAGYSDAPGAHRAMASIRQKTPEILAELGLDLKTLVRDHIKPGLQANETQFFAHEGRVRTQRTTVAWGERRQYADTICKIGGYYQQPDDGSKSHSNAAVTINLALLDADTASALLAATDGDEKSVVLVNEHDKDTGRAGRG